MPLQQGLGAGRRPPGRVGSRSGSRDHRPATVGGPVRVGIAGRPSRGRPYARGRCGARGAAGWLRCVPPPPSRVRSGARVSLVSDAGPHEVPDQVGHRGVVGGADQVGQPAEEQRLPAGELLEDRAPSSGTSSGSGSSSGARSAGHQADPAVAAGQPTGAGPQHLAGAGQLVEHRRGVVAHPRRQHERLQGAGRDQRAGELLDHREDAVGAAQPAADALPGRCEPGQRRRSGPAPPPGAAWPGCAGGSSAAPRRRTTPGRCRRAGTRR